MVCYAGRAADNTIVACERVISVREQQGAPIVLSRQQAALNASTVMNALLAKGVICCHGH
jgi:hypothetical protein